jgi:hypothetical protein
MHPCYRPPPHCSRTRSGGGRAARTPARARRACLALAQPAQRAPAARVSSVIGCSRSRSSSRLGGPSARGACPSSLDRRVPPPPPYTSFALRGLTTLSHACSTPGAVHVRESAVRCLSVPGPHELMHPCPLKKPVFGHGRVSRAGSGGRKDDGGSMSRRRRARARSVRCSPAGSPSSATCGNRAARQAWTGVRRDTLLPSRFAPMPALTGGDDSGASANRPDHRRRCAGGVRVGTAELGV